MKQKRTNYAQMIITAALVVTVVRYVGAFIASDVGQIDGLTSQALSIFMGISGIGMGILDVVGTAFIFEGWRAQIPRRGDKIPNRFWVLSGFALACFMTSLYILTPFTMSRIAHESMEAVLGGTNAVGLGVWSFMVNLAPLLIIGGVMTSSRVSLQSQDSPRTVLGEQGPTSATAKKFQCKQCSESFETLGQLGTHVKYKHPKNPRTS